MAVAIEDLNRDGKVDLVTANGWSSSGSVSVLLGDGHGNFGPKTDFAAGAGSPPSLEVGDLNGDGKTDAVVHRMAGDGDTIFVLLGSGDGTFGPQAGFPIAGHSRHIAIGDLNRDGRLDLVVPMWPLDSLTSVISVLLGNGDGTFGASTDFPATDWFEFVALADLDGDDDLDLVGVCGSTVGVLPGHGDGTFGAETDYDGGGSCVAVGDLDGNHTPDLVVTGLGGDGALISVRLGRGDGTFGASVEFTINGAFNRRVAIGDLNADGAADLAVTTIHPDGHSADLSALLGKGDGTFGGSILLATGAYREGLVIGDLNGDREPDLAVTDVVSNTVTVLLGRGGPSSDHLFAAPFQRFDSGLAPSCVAMGDVNNDGAPDLVTANFDGNSVSVLVGNGDGSFGASVEFALGMPPTWVAIGDLNADGATDLVVTGREGWGAVLLGDGHGNFDNFSGLYTREWPTSVAIGDLNADGKPDLAVTNGGSYPVYGNSVSVLIGYGNGDFGEPTDFVTGSAPTSVAIRDLNGDGAPDLTVANSQEATVSVLLGNGTGTFGAKTDFATGDAPSSVAIGDLNGDGKLDLAASCASVTSVLFGAGDGTFGARTDLGAWGDAGSVAIGDLNGDQKPDLAVVKNVYLVIPIAWFGVLSVTPGNGDGTFGAATNFPAGDEPKNVVMGDLNDDGDADLVIANGSGGVSVLLGPFVGKMDYRVLSLFRPGSLALGDLNADGKSDLAVAGSEEDLVWDNFPVVVRLGDGQGGFGEEYYVRDEAVDPVFVAIGDLNGDGKGDLAVVSRFPVSSQYGVFVRLGHGDGTFGTGSTYDTGSQPGSVAIGDLNRDHVLDLVAVETGADAISVLLGHGDGSFGPRTDFATGSQPSCAAIGDVNKDGKADLAVTNVVSGTVSVLLGNGLGGFGMRTDLVTGDLPMSVVIGDLNEDDKPDLAVANWGSSSVSVFLGTGNGTFGNRTDFDLGHGAISVAIADLNADLHRDLAVMGYYGVAVLPGHGDGTFGQWTDYGTGSRPSSFGVRDLNADGKLDLVVADWANRSVSVLTNLGNRSVLAVEPVVAALARVLQVAAPWPNPSRGMSEIRIDLPLACDVAAAVLDLAGRRVRSLVAAEHLAAGQHDLRWDGRDGSGAMVRPGIYFLHVRAGRDVATKRLVVVR